MQAAPDQDIAAPEPQDVIEETIEQATAVAEQLRGYGDVMLEGLIFLLGGLAVVFVLNQIAKRLLYPRLARTRAARVLFGTLYAFIIVLSVIVLIERQGFETGALAQMALLLVALGGILAFFVLPFLPTLPFKLGNMVELNGTLGIVDTITPFHTHLRTFDGNMVFIPNTHVLGSPIVNYNHTPLRRVELAVRFTAQSDLARGRSLLDEVMRTNEAVLGEPAPLVVVTHADAAGTDVTGWCWVENAQWMGARSELWARLMAAVAEEPGVALALPRREVSLTAPTAAPTASDP
jgi:small conductance mechanosensitive channel